MTRDLNKRCPSPINIILYLSTSRTLVRSTSTQFFGSLQLEARRLILDRMQDCDVFCSVTRFIGEVCLLSYCNCVSSFKVTSVVQRDTIFRAVVLLTESPDEE